MQTVAIFGVGLIGGSFGLALRQAGFSGRILGVSSAATLERARARNIIDAGVSPEQAASEADLIYIAQPIRAILETLPLLNAWVHPGALVTDAGSTKQVIVECAARHLTRAQFLGGHPLAGKETRGPESAEAGLFRNRTYILTPRTADELDTDAAREFLDWLRRIGAVPLIFEAGRHDRTVAYTSHLPQLASTALGMVLGEHGDAVNQAFGPGALDSTRLALSPYEMWADILETNAGEIEGALSDYIRALEKLRNQLKSREMEGNFLAAAALARLLRSASGTGLRDLSEGK